MSTATITSKGQITIPATVRHALGLSTGDKVEFIEGDNGQFVLVAATLSVQSLKGIIRRPKTPVSIDMMNNTIARHGALAR
jgi:AbrB family looped-hinge helix DNA binding protein